MPSGYLYDLSRKHSCLFTCQKQDCIGYIFRLDQLPHRNDRNHGLLQILIYPSRLCRAGCDAVHCDPILSHFQRNAARKRFERRLTRTIGDLSCKDLGSIRGKINDTSVIPTVIDQFPDHQNAAPDIDRKGIVDHLLGDALYGIQPVFVIGCGVVLGLPHKSS